MAAEGIFAFFLESGFLAILLFGWDRVGSKLHFFATCMVCPGAHFSTVWIAVANSWMQTPAGYHLERTVNSVAERLPPGHIVTTADLGSVRAVSKTTGKWFLIPSSVDRLIHVVLGAWMAGAFLVVSISAYYVLLGRHGEFARTSMKIGLVFATVETLLQMVSEDFTARGVVQNQPLKLAAMEGLYEIKPYTPMTLFGWLLLDEPAAGLDHADIDELGRCDGLVPVAIGNEDGVPWQALHEVLWLFQICGKNIRGVRGEPCREIDRGINASVESKEHLARKVADVFDRVAVALRNVSNVARFKDLGAKAAMGPEKCHADASRNDILPFGRGWMPVQFAQSAGFELQNDPGHRLRNWEIRRIHSPFSPPFVNRMRLLRRQAILVGERRRFRCGLPGFRNFARRLFAKEKYASSFRRPINISSDMPRFFASKSAGAWPSQSVMLKVPNSEK